MHEGKQSAKIIHDEPERCIKCGKEIKTLDDMNETPKGDMECIECLSAYYDHIYEREKELGRKPTVRNQK